MVGFELYQEKVFEVLNKVSEVPFLAQYKEQIDVRPFSGTRCRT